jgi:hypothetical protein
MAISINKIAEFMSVTEFVRLGALVDDYCRKTWTRFDVIKLVRDQSGLAVWVDAGKGMMFWVVVTPQTCYVQKYRAMGSEAA